MRVWRADSGACTHSLAGHDGAVLGVDVSGDGLRVLSCGQDGAVKLWVLAEHPLLAAY